MYEKLEKLTVFYPTYILQTWWIQSCTWYLNVVISQLCKIQFGKSYLPLDSNTNTATSDRFAYTCQDGGENRDKAECKLKIIKMFKQG